MPTALTAAALSVTAGAPASTAATGTIAAPVVAPIACGSAGATRSGVLAAPTPFTRLGIFHWAIRLRRGTCRFPAGRLGIASLFLGVSLAASAATTAALSLGAIASRARTVRRSGTGTPAGSACVV